MVGTFVVVARGDEYPVAAARVVERRLDGTDLPGDAVIGPDAQDTGSREGGRRTGNRAT
jgi:hypothetical protein